MDSYGVVNIDENKIGKLALEEQLHLAKFRTG